MIELVAMVNLPMWFLDPLQLESKKNVEEFISRD